MEEQARQYAKGDLLKYDAFIAAWKAINKTKKQASIEEREQKFKKLLEPYIDQYGKDMLNRFYSYWTEKNASGKKMRFETEKIFEVAKRLATWYRNSKEREFKRPDLPDTPLVAKRTINDIDAVFELKEKKDKLKGDISSSLIAEFRSKGVEPMSADNFDTYIKERDRRYEIKCKELGYV